MIDDREISPQLNEKPYLYTKPNENLWNNPNLTSSKISKYYHDIQRRFLSSPNSPSLCQKSQMEQEEFLKTQQLEKHKRSAKHRLNARKYERTELESYCKNSSNSPLPQISHIRVSSQLSYTICDAAKDYHKYDRLPIPAHKMVFTSKIASLEARSIADIMTKTQSLNRKTEEKKEKIKFEALKERQKMILSHKRNEEKSGIRKIRLHGEEFSVNSFGFERKYKVSGNVERLSRPKEVEMYSPGKSDMRGVVHTASRCEDCETSVSGSKLWASDMGRRMSA